MTQTYNQAGIFAVKVYIRGRPYTVVVDDYLPFNQITGSSLLFDWVTGKEGLWAVILEKAWAKASGNYDFLSAGWNNEAIDFVTGAPSTTYNNNNSPINNIGVNAWNIINSDDIA